MGSPSTGRVGGEFSSFEEFAQAGQAAGDAAGDRPRRDPECRTDGVVALVAGEEAVEDLAAVLREAGHRLVDGEGLVQRLHGLVGAAGHRLRVDDLLAGARADPVDARAARELADPGPDRLVGAELLEVLVRAREDLLEDLLGVLLAEPVRLAADGVDVPREARDELAPRVLVAAAAAGDELGVW